MGAGDAGTGPRALVCGTGSDPSLCCARSAAMAAPWRDVVRDAAAVREAAAVAVDAALLAGVLMRTGEQPHASDVSAQRGEEPLPCPGSLSPSQAAAPGWSRAELGLRLTAHPDDERSPPRDSPALQVPFSKERGRSGKA